MSDTYLTGGGGGATTVARVSGNLSTLSSQLSQVLVVAAGGGGSAIMMTDGLVTSIARGGSGGGFVGGDADLDGVKILGTGATQADGYAFGQGQAQTNLLGGGGSGLYGGYNVTNTTEIQAFGMSSYTGNDAVRYDASDIVVSESGITICHGGFGDLNSLSNPYASFEDGVLTISSYGDGARGWVYDTSVNHNIIPANCIINVKLDILFTSGNDFELYFSSETTDRKRFEYNYNVCLDYGNVLPQISQNVWYSTEYKINMVNGVLLNYTFYVNDASITSGTLNQHMVNVDELNSIPCSVIGIKVPSSDVKIRNFYISWEERV